MILISDIYLIYDLTCKILILSPKYINCGYGKINFKFAHWVLTYFLISWNECLPGFTACGIHQWRKCKFRRCQNISNSLLLFAFTNLFVLPQTAYTHIANNSRGKKLQVKCNYLLQQEVSKRSLCCQGNGMLVQ